MSYGVVHWHRLVKHIWWANQNIGGQKVVKSDKCLNVSKLLGDTCSGCPQSTPKWSWVIIGDLIPILGSSKSKGEETGVKGKRFVV